MPVRSAWKNVVAAKRPTVQNAVILICIGAKVKTVQLKHTVMYVMTGKSSMWNFAMNVVNIFALIADIWTAVKSGETLAQDV